VEILSDGVTIDDGTGVAKIALSGAAADYLPLLEPADPINAIGRVERRGDDLVVVVSDAAGLSRASDPVDGSTDLPAADAAVSAAPALAGATLAYSTDLLGVSGAGLAGLASIALLTLASIGVTLLRRRRMRRQLVARVSARLAAVATPSRASLSSAHPTQPTASPGQ
jgi:hypothetical protein